MRIDPTEQMVLANRLTDGRVVFLAADGNWVENIESGARSADDQRAAEMLAAAHLAESRGVVVEPYLIGIRHASGRLQPVSFREGIRARGPTVRTDLAG